MVGFVYPPWLEALSVFIFGAMIGSFLNVVIFRLPRGRSVVSPSSRTYPWRSSIPWYLNIPILSYLISGGRDKKSGLFYSPRYLVVELLTPLVFLAIYFVHGWTLTSLLYFAFSSVLIAGTFIDLDLRILPNSLTLGAWGVALVFALLQSSGYPIPIEEAVLGSVLGYGLFWVMSRAYYWITGEEGLGGGDVKWMGFIGAVIGVEGVVITIVVASVMGATVGLLMMLFLKKGRRTPIPFGPFLAMGALSFVFSLDLQVFFGW